jgi:hypothetical protein
MDSGGASMLELLGGLLTSREVLWPSEPRLSLSTLQRMNLEALYEAKPHILISTYTEGDMGRIYRRWGGCPPQAWGSLEHLDGRPAVHVASRPTFSAFTDFGHHRPTPLTSFDKCMKRFSKICQTLVGRPHFDSVGPGLCAMSSPHVILSVTMSYFRHNKDMHGFWSIWWFFVISCS